MESDVLRLAFETCALTQDDWDHRAHLHMGWIYLKEVPLDQATLRLKEGIFRYEEGGDRLCNYHETLTLFWMKQIGKALKDAPPEENFPAFLKRNAFLQEKRLVLQYYSQPRIISEEAREHWVEPDRMPLETPPQALPSRTLDLT
jgi:hypothetical protein